MAIIASAISAICSIIESCSPESPSTQKKQTLILYVVANNNLVSQGEILMAELAKGEIPDSCNLVVFYRGRERARLYSIDNHLLSVKKEYGNINCVSKAQISVIMRDIKKNYPAKEYGLVLWSHGTGWLPTGNDTTRSFGDDGGEAIDITDLAESLNVKLDYLIFDACYMGTIEVATEFQDICKYLVASPSAIPSEGIINSEALSLLVKKRPLLERLKELCINSHEKRNIPISLINMSQLSPFIDAINQGGINLSKTIINEVTIYPFHSIPIFFDLYFLSKIGYGKDTLSTLEALILFPEVKEKDCFVSVFIPTENNVAYWHNYSRTKWNVRTNWLGRWNNTDSCDGDSF